ncbi:phage tail protein I [Rouxiella badensis]|uniref:phage tail protein I n=1 Tax=Rouxiella badensis TaxID=1646377 RepID=UPI0013EF4E49|nr:phage tail protein I [Rouxiella badensis]QII37362.1 phage tail protein I [Rouxiella badensis]
MNSLLPSGSTQFERLAAEACAAVSDLAVPLRDLWNPDTCPVAFLPYLAWAFSVDRWDEKWTAAEKRQAINSTFYIHRRKGTVAAIRRIIENLGYSMTLTEWWQIADPRGTFRLTVDVNEIGITADLINELERLISDAKPVSRSVSQLSLSVKVAGVISVGAALFDGDILTVYPADYQPDDSIFYDGVAYHDGNFVFSEKVE